MNVCEKIEVVINVYEGFWLFKKDANFRGVKKLFVLQEISAQNHKKRFYRGRRDARGESVWQGRRNAFG
jgi:hypothetical protein